MANTGFVDDVVREISSTETPTAFVRSVVREVSVVDLGKGHSRDVVREITASLETISLIPVVFVMT